MPATLPAAARPAPIDTHFHPFQAIAAARRLIANPDNTQQVFVIIRAMRGRSASRMFARFAAGETGAAILREHRVLLRALENDKALARLGPRTLGRDYRAFMAAQNLSAAGLVESSRAWNDEILPAPVALFRERMRDMHDLTHVLTGYGRDPLGELCLLAFMLPHNRNSGMAILVLMGLWRAGSTKARRAVFEARRHGRAARWLPGQDWENLLGEDLSTLRAHLNIAPARRYHAAMG